MACLGFRIQTKTRLFYSTFVNPIQKAKFVLPQTLTVSMTQGKSKRPICPSCSKPVRTCICSRILTPGIENSVSVTILQHAPESKHPLNSTRIARLGLNNLRVATVSDVLFEARFMIRLMEPSLEPGLVSGQASENGETQKSVDETEQCSKCYREEDSALNGSGESCSSERNGIRAIQSSQISVCGNLVANSDSKLNLSDAVVLNDKASANEEKYPRDPTKGVYEDNGGPAITSTIGKYGCIRSLSHIWDVSQTQTQKPSFRKILACPDVHEALSKGFLVRRLQRKQLNGSIDLEDEFELEVPSGSALLFPSDKAVDVGDLAAIGFKVKNLIVLDGTWAKARRIYSENPWLEILPHLKLEVNKKSLYSEVRHQPKAGYLSTIESIVYALRAVGENHEGLDNLLDAFESMVGDQRRCKNERLTG